MKYRTKNYNKLLKKIESFSEKIKEKYIKDPKKSDIFLEEINNLRSLLINSQKVLSGTKEFILKSEIRSLEERINTYKIELQEQDGPEAEKEDRGKKKKGDYLSAKDLAGICGVNTSFIRSMKLQKCREEGAGKSRYVFAVGDTVSYLVSGKRSKKKERALKNLRQQGYEKLVDRIIFERKEKLPEAGLGDKLPRQEAPRITDANSIPYSEAPKYLGVSLESLGKYLDEEKINLYKSKKKKGYVFKRSELDKLKKEWTE